MTTTSICFYNNGTLDKRAFTMLGLSAKSSDEAIGFFGTGFKYAIATILRHGCDVTITANGKEYNFYTKSDRFRDTEYNAIYCSYALSSYDNPDGVVKIELPFTTHLGASWKLWQAYRELFTNAKDEGGGVQPIDIDDPACTFKPGDVCVYVTGPDFVAVYDNHDMYFLNAETVVQGYKIRAVAQQQRSNNVVYYKTMYTGTQLDRLTYFTYDYTHTMPLTEDRTLNDTWLIGSHICELWLEKMSYDLLIEHLPKIAKDVYYEYHLNTGYHTGSEDFMRACEYLNKHNRPMPMWARDAYIRQLPFSQQIEPYTPTRFERRKLKRAIAILAHHKRIIDTDKLVLCASLPEDVLGYYNKGFIYISREAFNRGFEKLLGTLYEEHIHMIEGLDDMSRAIQNLLVDKCAALMEQVYMMEHEYEDK